MKISKINLAALSCNECLSQLEMKRCVGGYDTESDTQCFFNCMEYIGKNFYNSNDYDYQYYGNAYVNGFGTYEGTHDENDIKLGPIFYDKDDKINGSIAQYIGQMFGSAASGFVTGSDIRDLFKNGENTGVMGIYRTGDDVGHVVILQGYDPNTGQYSYYDPSKSEQDENQFINAGDICGAIDCLVDSKDNN
ncbi:MAG: TIGR04149 family rSAM-modified RiPP [Bacteroidaceae bacterium]|nr:TIGR04149 family rSAM-modified RiPP [Bacteroidaceae bacterium]